MFRGGLPQLTDTSVVVEPHARHLLTTVTTGSVLAELNLICRGFEAHGVELAGPPTAAAHAAGLPATPGATAGSVVASLGGASGGGGGVLAPTGSMVS